MVPLCYQRHAHALAVTTARRFTWGAIGCACALLTTACSPTFNWRTVDLSPAPWQALLPCKPERAERPVPLTDAQTPIALKMASCDAAGLTFALAYADVVDPALAPAAQERWQRATWTSFRVTPAMAPALPEGWTAWAVPSETGLTQTQTWTGSARTAGGEAMGAQLLWAQQGRWLLQAAVYGPKGSSPEAVDTFFAGLRGTKGAP